MRRPKIRNNHHIFNCSYLKRHRAFRELLSDAIIKRSIEVFLGAFKLLTFSNGFQIKLHQVCFILRENIKMFVREINSTLYSFQPLFELSKTTLLATLTETDGKVVKEGKGDGRPLSVRKISTTTRKEVVEMWGCAAARS